MAVSRSAKTSGARQAGFSLIEVVVVIGIIAVALAVAFNGQSMVADRRLTGMARKMATDVRMIEQRARTERTCYRIEFDPSGEAYTIYRYNGAITPGAAGSGPSCSDTTSWGSTPAIAEDSGDTVSRRMPGGIDLVSATFPAVGPLNVLTMSPLGNGDAGTVTIRSVGGAVRQVVVEVFGRVRILP